MYYAYAKSCEGWKARRQRTLEARLEEFVRGLPLDGRGQRPYLQIRPGWVAIRRLTHYSEEQCKEIRRAADKIYDEVMEIGDFAKPKQRPQKVKLKVIE